MRLSRRAPNDKPAANPAVVLSGPQSAAGFRQLLSGWNKFPLLSCVDCIVWTGRHDYRLVGDQIVLSNLSFDTRGVQTTRRSEALKSIAVDLFADIRQHEPLVGGSVPWVQAPVGVPCLQCREPMVYVAAMTTPARFRGQPFINNASGYQFHFALS